MALIKLMEVEEEVARNTPPEVQADTLGYTELPS